MRRIGLLQNQTKDLFETLALSLTTSADFESCQSDFTELLNRGSEALYEYYHAWETDRRGTTYDL